MGSPGQACCYGSIEANKTDYSQAIYGLMHINGSIDLKQRCPTFRTFDPGEVGTDYVDDTFEVNSFSACLDNR
jgi:hypothetical protein